jgi:periplasmic divalent cation tolerance protein
MNLADAAPAPARRGEDGAILVLTTCADREQALALGRALVGERLAACASALPGARSIYRWRDAVEEADETPLLIKTTRAAWPALEARVRELHSYEVAELLAVDVAEGAAPYLAWLFGSVAGGPDGA